MKSTLSTLLLRVAAGGSLLATIACGGGAERDADTGANGTIASGDTAAMTGDSGMSGTSRGTMVGDQGFLAMMSDHHEGLIAMAEPAMNKATGGDTKADAHELHVKQAAERDSMVAMLRTSFSASHTPMIMPKNKAQNDTLQSLSGQAYDRKFYQLVIAHHREGIAMIDSSMGSLSNQKVREMAAKMKEDQQREIREFEPKAGGGS